MKWLDRVLVYDIEVYRHFWSITFKEYGKDVYYAFSSSSTDGYQGLMNQQVREFLQERDPILVGFNNKGYDNHVLALILHDYSHEDIKEFNDYIINDSGEYHAPWDWHKYPQGYYFHFPFIDLMDDLAERMSLKMYEGNKGMSIEETSVPFDLDRPLTADEIELNDKYNRFDVDATEELLNDRMSYIKTKIELAEMADVSMYRALGMTNAKLVSSYLAPRITPKTDWGD